MALINLFHVFSFFTALVVTSHAALSPELYWKQQLPNTEMPQSIKDMLYTDLLDDKSTSVVVGKGGVGVDTKGKHGGTTVGVGKGGVGVDTTRGKHGGTTVGVGKGGVGVHTGKGKPGGGTKVGVGHGGVGVSTGKPGKRTNVGVGKGGVSVHTGRKGRPVYVGVKPGPNPFNYQYAATDTQANENPNVALFFLEKDLQNGKTMTLHFPKTLNQATFLPRKVANAIPFSSKHFPEILDRFSVNPKSTEADIMKNTIKECEEVGIRGEEKYCATSLEYMINYAKSKLGKDVKVVSTEVREEAEIQNYKIEGVRKVISGEETKYEVCHKLNYAYAVFYCHKTEKTKAFVVPLKGVNDGTEVKAVAVCHTDTSRWNPKHLAFKVLGVKPGTVPVCHFLPQDHLVWYNN